MSLIEHAKRELLAAGYSPDADDGPTRWIYEYVVSLIKTFAEQGHSGQSAPIVASIFGELARFRPLGPLRGTDDEWAEVDAGIWQNNRCSRIFKGEDGRAYDIDGIIWRDPDGSCFTNGSSRVYVDFPYTPKSEYRDRPAGSADVQR
jgi:hypothetical protein